MHLSVIQFAPVLCDRKETTRRLGPLLEQCAAADLIVLPELCNSGYNFAGVNEAMESSESIDESPFLEYLAERCTALGCEIVTGLNERAGDDLYNSAVLVSARGVEGLYRKLHLFMNEKDIFQPGDRGLPVFARPYGVIGIQICFDWAFFEPWRVLALKGAELICHPSNLVLPDRAQRAIPIYAMTNRVFVATANRCGTERDLTFTGRSLIANPRGDILLEAGTTEATVLHAELDLAAARDKAVTNRNDAFKDRRPDAYSELLRP